MLLAISIFMAVCLMTLGYIFKRPAMALGASGAWLIAGLAAYNSSTVAWDMYYGMFWFCMALVIASAFEAFYAKEKPIPPEPPQSDEEKWADDIESRRARFDRMRGLSRTHPRSRTSKYAKTGKPD